MALKAARTALFPILFGLVLFLADPAFACLSSAQVQQAIASGQAKRLSWIKQQLGNRGEIVKVSLCNSGGGLVYRLTILGSGGRVVQLSVDARSGRPR